MYVSLLNRILAPNKVENERNWNTDKVKEDIWEDQNATMISICDSEIMTELLPNQQDLHHNQLNYFISTL